MFLIGQRVISRDFRKSLVDFLASLILKSLMKVFAAVDKDWMT